MTIAILEYICNNDPKKSLILENSSLQNCDLVTKKFSSEKELILASKYTSLIRQFRQDEDLLDGKIVLSYIKNNNDKIDIPIIYNDHEEIIIKAESLENKIAEVEKARKLLFSSKNKMFLKSFLNSSNMEPTVLYSVKMTYDEYKTAKREGLNVFNRDGDFYILLRDVFKYRLNHNKLGHMRLLVEDSLEVWRNNILNMSTENLYFYSRELRCLINNYNERKMPHQLIYNLKVNISNLTHLNTKVHINTNNTQKVKRTKGLMKILKEGI